MAVMSLIQTLMYGSNVFNPVSTEEIVNQTILFIEKPGSFRKVEAFNWSTYWHPFPYLNTPCLV